MTYTIMGIDPSTQSTGVSIFEIDLATRDILSIQTYKLDAKLLDKIYPLNGGDVSVIERIRLIIRYIKKVIVEHTPTIIYSELPHVDVRHINNIGPLYVLREELKRLVHNINPRPKHLRMHATQCKKIIGANTRKGRTHMNSKERVLDSMLRVKVITDLIDITTISDDEVDAILVAYAGHWLPSDGFMKED